MLRRLCCCGRCIQNDQDTVQVGVVFTTRPSTNIPLTASGHLQGISESSMRSSFKGLKTNSIRPESATTLSPQDAWSTKQQTSNQKQQQKQQPLGRYPLFSMDSVNVFELPQHEDEEVEEERHKEVTPSEFIKAAKNGTLEEVQMMLNTPGMLVHIDARGMWDNTPLIVACQNARACVALAILNAGASVQLLNERGNSALLFACIEHMDALCLRLLDRGANAHVDASSLYCEVTDSMQSLTPLAAAALTGNAELVGVLLKHGALNTGYNAGIQETKQTDIHKITANVLGPLLCATISNNLKTVEMLLDEQWKGCWKYEIQEVDQQGNSLVHSVVTRGGDPLILETILDHGARVDAENILGESPLILAVRANRLAIVHMLLLRGANPNADDSMNADTTEGTDTLEESGSNGRYKDGSVANGSGARTALMEACSNGSLECARELLDAGACVTRADAYGTTALKIAQAEEHDSLIEMLKSWLARDHESGTTATTR